VSEVVGLETALDRYTAILQKWKKKMEQMIEYLIAAIGGLEAAIHNHQAKTDANLKEIVAKM
jgi:hypothetical protein